MRFNASLYQRYNVFDTPSVELTDATRCKYHIQCALVMVTVYVYYTYTVHGSLTLSRVEQARSVKRPALPASARLARPACKTS